MKFILFVFNDACQFDFRYYSLSNEKENTDGNNEKQKLRLFFDFSDYKILLYMTKGFIIK